MYKVSKINQIAFCGEGLKKRLGIKYSRIFISDKTSFPTGYIPQSGNVVINIKEHKKFHETGAAILISKIYDYEDSWMNQLLHSVAHELIHALRRYIGIFREADHLEAQAQLDIMAECCDWDIMKKCEIYYGIIEEKEANTFAAVIVKNKSHFFTYKGSVKR